MTEAGGLRRHPQVHARAAPLHARRGRDRPDRKLRQPVEPDVVRRLLRPVRHRTGSASGRPPRRLGGDRRQSGLRAGHDERGRLRDAAAVRRRRHDGVARPGDSPASEAAGAGRHPQRAGERDAAGCRRPVRRRRHVRVRRPERLLQRRRRHRHRQRPADRIGGDAAVLHRSPAHQPRLVPESGLADPVEVAADQRRVARCATMRRRPTSRCSSRCGRPMARCR